MPKLNVTEECRGLPFDVKILGVLKDGHRTEDFPVRQTSCMYICSVAVYLWCLVRYCSCKWLLTSSVFLTFCCLFSHYFEGNQIAKQLLTLCLHFFNYPEDVPKPLLQAEKF